MRLSDIKKLVEGEAARLAVNTEVSGVALHSRDVRPGWVFVAITGTAVDGRMYVEDAVRRGAAAVISTQPLALPVCVITVQDARLAAARLAAAFNGYPSRTLQVAGVTGTNGKTTVATMVKAVLERAGRAPGMVGTVAYEIGPRVIAATRTTPDAVTLQGLLRQMVTAGCHSAVLEVSSHALVQHRTAGIDFAVAAFTNLTRDHLDYHGTMEAYYEAKAILFRELGSAATAVINRDDAWGRRLLGEPPGCGRLSYGLEAGADIRAEDVALTLEGSEFRIQSPWGTHAARVRLPGRYNVSNALACFGLCCALDCTPETVLEALAGVSLVRGRLERVAADRMPFNVFVDYAHTDDALRQVLGALRPLTQGRLITVFGCGGNRDRSKRRLMGAVAVEASDHVVVTTDNPRNEAPDAIIADIIEGAGGSAKVTVIADRKAAILQVLEMAEAGDTVLIAGKGHETYQETAGRVMPFNDVDVVRKAMER